MSMPAPHSFNEDQLEAAVRAAFDHPSSPPPGLAGRIRLAVAHEAAIEPVRRRQSFILGSGLCFATACALASLVSEVWIGQGRHPEGIALFANKPITVGSRVHPAIGDHAGSNADPLNLNLATREPLAPSNHLRQNRRDFAPIWKTESVVFQPVIETAELFEPSTVRISVNDPAVREIRSLHVERELRDGELHSEVQFQSRPIQLVGN